jgi:hypothetical protein
MRTVGKAAKIADSHCSLLSFCLSALPSLLSPLSSLRKTTRSGLSLNSASFLWETHSPPSCRLALLPCSSPLLSLLKEYAYLARSSSQASERTGEVPAMDADGADPAPPRPPSPPRQHEVDAEEKVRPSLSLSLSLLAHFICFFCCS